MDIPELLEYVRSEMKKPYIEGDTDCCNTTDRWVSIKLGFSPLSKYGRLVRSKDDMDRWLSERFGMMGGVLRVMRTSGLSRTNNPVSGDIGLIAFDDKACMAICLGDFWFTRDIDGLIFSQNATVMRAWST